MWVILLVPTKCPGLRREGYSNTNTCINNAFPHAVITTTCTNIIEKNYFRCHCTNRESQHMEPMVRWKPPHTTCTTAARCRALSKRRLPTQPLQLFQWSPTIGMVQQLPQWILTSSMPQWRSDTSNKTWTSVTDNPIVTTPSGAQLVLWHYNSLSRS